MVPKSTNEKRARAFETGGFLFDERLTRAALELTSPDIKTEEQAAALFHDVAKASGTFSTDDWDQAQAWLRRWLPKIAGAHRLEESSADALARDLSQQIAAVGIGEPRIGRRLGRYELTMYADEDTIWMACVRAVLPFLPEYGWTDRLGQCEISDCGKWFLRKNISGPPRKYCGDEHATVARSRRYRGKRA